MKKQIIVVGIYRSGTSLITGTLHHLGLDVGKHDFHSHPIKNPKGFWECWDMVDLNEYLRSLCRKTYLELDKRAIKKVIKHSEANEKVKAYINKRNKKDIWAAKDPKTIPFFELYEKYLENPYYIFIERASKSVINSWKAVETASSTRVENAYWNHRVMVDAIRRKAVEKNIPHMELYYGWYVDNREEACQKLAEFVEVDVTQKAIDFCNTYSGGMK